MALQPGLSGRLTIEVAREDTAEVLGTGDVPVLATPRVLALAEAACCQAVDERLDRGQTTVETRVQLEHMSASPLGARLTVVATLAHLDGRLLRFEVLAEEADGRLVAHGQLTRVVVDRARFLERSGLGGSA